MHPVYLIFYFTFILYLTPNAQELSAENLMLQMFKKADEVNTLKYEMHKSERIEGKLKKSIAFSKFRRNPLSVYLKQSNPKKGLEVLFPAAPGSDKAIINTNSFPWFSFKADPNGSIMRNDQHHSIIDSGFDHFMGIMKFLMNKYKSEIKNLVSLKNDTVFDGKECYVIVFNNPHFKYIEHEVREGENLFNIAAKNKISEYMILNINDKIDDYYDISPGQKINTPNDYAPKMVLYIDKKLNLPLIIKVYDDKSVYERYEYRKLEFNPILANEEFSHDYKEYDF